MFKDWFKRDNNRDIVRYIRTEYYEDTKHMRDDDCVHFYRHILSDKRNRKKCRLA